MTRAQLAASCAEVVPLQVFDSRFHLFVEMGLLQRSRDKPHEHRYLFNPTSSAALLVFDRLSEVGGVQEIAMLLGRIRDALEEGDADEAAVERMLIKARRELSINADHLRHLVRSREFEQLIAERRHHRAGDQLLEDARGIVQLASERFPRMSHAGRLLIADALGYSAAVNEFLDRLFERAKATRDFSMLLPEQYRTAALRSFLGDLAEVFASTAFDPPTLLIQPHEIIATVREYRPAPARRRPPRPAETPTGVDPVELARQRAAALRERRWYAIQLLLQGAREAELSGMTHATWAGAVQVVVNALVAHADPEIPLEVTLSNAVLVDPPGPVSYATPMTLRRTDGTTPPHSESSPLKRGDRG
ncbi:hypothetical protein FHX34_102155 [Actinoplanes teichomyceticus]|uniref:Uncharacterized protein n=2 Tax=Actinoplanes teichomyceticus TaxID=1867 RepID=A0A561WIB7_ACTTI|nr:hypothetical protein FHX34_102155 [Actinoplanes teichomyceticus]